MEVELGALEGPGAGCAVVTRWQGDERPLAKLVPGPASDRFLAREIDAAVGFARSGEVRLSAEADRLRIVKGRR